MWKQLTVCSWRNAGTILVYYAYNDPCSSSLPTIIYVYHTSNVKYYRDGVRIWKMPTLLCSIFVW